MVGFSSFVIVEAIAEFLLVTEDLVRYMNSAIAGSDNGNFLVEDPVWAEDFAPNGESLCCNLVYIPSR